MIASLASIVLLAGAPSPALAGERSRLSVSWEVADEDAVRVVAGPPVGGSRGVTLTARPCRRGAKVFEVRGPGLSRRALTRRCSVRILLPREGRFTSRVRESGVARFGPSTRLAPRRRLIIALGDSFTSGEGNPDRSGLYVPERDASGAVVGVATLRRARWRDRRCHRSAVAAPVLAARAIADGHTHLTLVHLACTGARVRDGLLGPGGGTRSQLLLDGVAQVSSPAPAQVALTRRAVGRRRVDAVLVGIGGNELGFSEIVRTCATSDRCQDGLAPAVPTRLATLDADLAALAVAMGPITARRRVVLVPYPDVVTGAGGSCAAPELGLDPDESEWTARAIDALNGTLRRVARRERWRFAGAASRALTGHGLCDARPWSVSLAASVARQGSETGTLHPDPSGQRALARAIARSLRATIPR